MVIDYSRWDNLRLSDDEEEEEDVTRAVESTSIPTSTVQTRIASSPSIVSHDERVECSFPKFWILVHSKLRDKIASQMVENGLGFIGKVGAYGISLPSDIEPLQTMCFSRFFPGLSYDQECQIVASLLSISTDQYMVIIGNRERSSGLMATVPYDAQFRGNALSSRESALHVRYGQEWQGLYKRVPGPEFIECKMGPLCGGPIVMIQARCRTGMFGTEKYELENVDMKESDIPKVVTTLLSTPNACYLS